MTEAPQELTLLESLDRRQEEVLRGLDALHERVMTTLEEWTTHSPHADATSPAADEAVTPLAIASPENETDEESASHNANPDTADAA